jgi:hypothetical protein
VFNSTVLFPLEADENIEALKHYYGITQQGELVVRGIDIIDMLRHLIISCNQSLMKCCVDQVSTTVNKVKEC